MEAKMRRKVVLDLFCGAGGLSKGFLDAGYEVELGVDVDKSALKTFEKNHQGASVLNIDLSVSENVDIISDYFISKNLNIDVLVGGPPCQGFSLAGPRDKNDKRNKLYYAMVEVARRLKPKAIVFENVPGILNLYGGKAAKRISKDFEDIGYSIFSKILYGPEFGLPQKRKRVFFVGLIGDEKTFIFPEPFLKEEDFVSCEDAIGDLPALEGIYGQEIQDYPCAPKTKYQEKMRQNSKKIFNHIGSIHIEKTVNMISLVPEGKNYKSLPEEYRSLYKYNEALTRYNSKEPSLTINTGHRSHFHYKYNRIPTVRESARLQSFPDDFIFCGNKSQQYAQVGNAVPPLLGYYIARQLEAYL
jgi:DNA (cytosine-5)-methyltransferase 1